MKTIEINKGGFGVVSLFNPELTNNNELVEQSNLKGKYLEELGIALEKGKVYILKTPLYNYPKAYRNYKIKVYNITDELYECEFVN